jgi:hypothetical protein
VTVRTALTVSASQTIGPPTPNGSVIYQGGINVQKGTLTMQPGIYILEGGGLTVANGASVQGTGVMIFNTGTAGPGTGGGAGAINIQGGATVSLTPPTTGTYTGISIYQDRAVTQNGTINFINNSISIQGAIYMVNAQLHFQGQQPTNPNPSIIGSVVICQKLEVNGGGNCNIDNTNYPRPAQSLYGLVD